MDRALQHTSFAAHASAYWAGALQLFEADRERWAAAVRSEQEEWTRLTGESLPAPGDYEKWREAALRFGIPPEKVFSLEFTVADVWTFVRGRRAAEQDIVRVAQQQAAAAAHDVADKASTAVAPDDDLTTTAVNLTGVCPDIVVLLNIMEAFSTAALCTSRYIAEELGLRRSTVKKAIRHLREQGLVVSTPGCNGGSWLTPHGRNVAERVPRSHCRNATLAMGLAAS